MTPIRILATSALLLSMAACMTNAPSAPAAEPAPVAGFVTDLDGFNAFIATRPTPAQFRAAYPDVTLVLPGQIATREFRTNNSRYFAELDDEGRISGGKFM